jgi:hypothetical protein
MTMILCSFQMNVLMQLKPLSINCKILAPWRGFQIENIFITTASSVSSTVPQTLKTKDYLM